ncbi:MAG: hypothetical protein V1660_04235 [archaeon]
MPKIAYLIIISLILLSVGTFVSFGVINSYKIQDQEGNGSDYIKKVIEPKREINLEDNDLIVKILPTEDRKINGTTTVMILSFPPDSGRIMVMLSPQSPQESSNPFEESNTLIELVEPSITPVFLDTLKVKNGMYTLAVNSAKKSNINPKDTSPWIATVQTEVIVQN